MDALMEQRSTRARERSMLRIAIRLYLLRAHALALTTMKKGAIGMSEREETRSPEPGPCLAKHGH